MTGFTTNTTIAPKRPLEEVHSFVAGLTELLKWEGVSTSAEKATAPRPIGFGDREVTSLSFHSELPEEERQQLAHDFAEFFNSCFVVMDEASEEQYPLTTRNIASADKKGNVVIDLELLRSVLTTFPVLEEALPQVMGQYADLRNNKETTPEPEVMTLAERNEWLALVKDVLVDEEKARLYSALASDQDKQQLQVVLQMLGAYAQQVRKQPELLAVLKESDPEFAEAVEVYQEILRRQQSKKMGVVEITRVAPSVGERAGKINGPVVTPKDESWQEKTGRGVVTPSGFAAREEVRPKGVRELS